MKRIISVLLLTMYIVTNFTFSVSADVDASLYTTNLFGDAYYNCSEVGIIGRGTKLQKFDQAVETGADAYDQNGSIKLIGRKQYLFEKTLEDDLLNKTVKVSFWLKATSDTIDNPDDAGKAKTITVAALPRYNTAENTTYEFVNLNDATIKATTTDEISTEWQKFSVTMEIPQDVGLADGQIYQGMSFLARIGDRTQAGNRNGTTAYIDCISLYVIPGEGVLETAISDIDHSEDTEGKTETVTLTVDTAYVDAQGAEAMEVVVDGDTLALDTDYEVAVSGSEITITLLNPTYVKNFAVTGIKDQWGREINCEENSSFTIARDKTTVTNLTQNDATITVELDQPYVDADSLADMVVTVNGNDLGAGAFSTVVDGNNVVITLTPAIAVQSVSVSGIKDLWGEDVDCTNANAYGSSVKAKAQDLKVVEGTVIDGKAKAKGLKLNINSDNVDNAGLADMKVFIEGKEYTVYDAAVASKNGTSTVTITFKNNYEVYAKEFAVTGIVDKDGLPVDCTKATLKIDRSKTAVTGVSKVVDEETGNTTALKVRLDNPYVDAAGLEGMQFKVNGATAPAYTPSFDGLDIVLTFAVPLIVDNCEIKTIKDLWGLDVNCDAAKIGTTATGIAVKGIATFDEDADGQDDGLNVAINSPYITESGLSGMIVRVNGEFLTKGTDYNAAVVSEADGNKTVKITFTEEKAVAGASVVGIVDQFGRKVDTAKALISAPVSLETYASNLLGEEYTEFDSLTLQNQKPDGWTYELSDDCISGEKSLKITGAGRYQQVVISKKIPITLNEAPKNMRLSAYVKASEDIKISDGKNWILPDAEYTFYTMRFVVSAEYTRPDGTTKVSTSIVRQDQRLALPDHPEWQYVYYDVKDLDYGKKVEGADIPEDGTLTAITINIYIHNSMTTTNIERGYILMDKVQVLTVPGEGEFLTVETETDPVEGAQAAKADKATFKYTGPVGNVEVSNVTIKENGSIVDMPIVITNTYNQETKLSEVSIVPKEGFVNGKNYEVTIANANDPWGRVISPKRALTFKAVDEIIAQPATEGGNVIISNNTSVTGSKVKLTNNNAITEHDAILVTAIVDGNNNITSYKLSNSATVGANGGETVLTSTLTSPYSGDGKAIAFVWDDLGGHRPLTSIFTKENGTVATSTNIGKVSYEDDEEGPTFSYNGSTAEDKPAEITVCGKLNGVAEGQLVSFVVYEGNVTNGLKYYDVQPAGADGTYEFKCLLDGEADTTYNFAVAAFGHYGETGQFTYKTKEAAAAFVATLVIPSRVQAAIESETDSKFLTIDKTVYNTLSDESKGIVHANIAVDITALVNAGKTPSVTDFKDSFNKHCADAAFAEAKAALKTEILVAVEADIADYFNALTSEEQDAILGEVLNANLATTEAKADMFEAKVIVVTANKETDAAEMLELISISSVGISFAKYEFLSDDEKATVIANVTAKDDYAEVADIKSAFDAEVQTIVDTKDATRVIELDSEIVDGKISYLDVVLSAKDYISDASIADMVVNFNGVDLEKDVDYTVAISTTENKITINLTEAKAVKIASVSGIKDVWGNDVNCDDATFFGADYAVVTKVVSKEANGKNTAFEVYFNNENVVAEGISGMVVKVDGKALTAGTDYTATYAVASGAAMVTIELATPSYVKDFEVSNIVDKFGDAVDCTLGILSIERAMTSVTAIEETKGETDAKTSKIVLTLDTPYVTSIETLVFKIDGKVETGYTQAIDGDKITITLDSPKVINTWEVTGIVDSWGRTVDCTIASSSADMKEVAITELVAVDSNEDGIHEGINVVFDSAYIDESGIANLFVKVNGEILENSAYVAHLQMDNKIVYIELATPAVIDSAVISGFKDLFGRKVNETKSIIRGQVTVETYATNMLGEEYTVFDSLTLQNQNPNGWTYELSDDSISGEKSLKITGAGRYQQSVISKRIPMTLNEAPRNIIVSTYVKASEDIKISDGKFWIKDDTVGTFYTMRFAISAEYTRPNGEVSSTSVAKIDKKITPDYPDWQYVCYEAKEIDFTRKVEGADIPEDGTLTGLTFTIYIHNSVTDTKIESGYVLMDRVEAYAIPDGKDFASTAKPVELVGEQKADKVTFEYNGTVGKVSKENVIIKEKNADGQFVEIEMPFDVEISYNDGVSSVDIIPTEGFDNGKEYQVSISGATDLWGRTIDGFNTASFDVKERIVVSEVAAEEPIINWNPATREVTGAKVKVENNDAVDAQNVVLVIAIFNERNNIREYKISTPTTVSANGETVELEANFADIPTLAANETAKVFLWDGTTNPKPLAGMISLQQAQ